MKRELLLAGFILPLVIVMCAAGHYYYDRPVAALFADLNGPVVAFFQIVTTVGVAAWPLIGSGFLFVYFFYISGKKKQARRMLYLFSSVAVSGLVTDVIKWLMGRWRPKLFIPEGLYGFEFFGRGYEQTSFPSGHATTICSLALALSLLYPRLRWVWIIIALLVCMSRVVIGAHYMSDVIMGAYVGIFTAFLLWKWPLFTKSIKGGLPY
jgi:membrane-associated phospholipid phosphatase